MKRVINIGLGLLFSGTFLLTVFTLTVLSKNFVLKVANENNMYEYILNKTCDNFATSDKNCLEVIDLKKVKKDFKRYVTSKYKNEYFYLDGEQIFRDSYNSSLKFDNYFSEYDITSTIYLIYAADIFLIILTGVIFLKTKSKHDLSEIIMINFIVSILGYGAIKIFLKIDNEFLESIFMLFNKYYLGSAIIVFELMIINKLGKNKKIPHFFWR